MSKSLLLPVLYLIHLPPLSAATRDSFLVLLYEQTLPTEMQFVQTATNKFIPLKCTSKNLQNETYHLLAKSLLGDHACQHHINWLGSYA